MLCQKGMNEGEKQAVAKYLMSDVATERATLGLSAGRCGNGCR